MVWDNRATMHRVMIDYPVGEKRVMQRVLIEGDRKFFQPYATLGEAAAPAASSASISAWA